MAGSKLAAIVCATIIAVSAFIIGGVTLLNRPSSVMDTKGSHFSVVWKGFKPDYSDTFPDYYICINNLKDNSLRMHVQLKIENYENISLYFMIDKYTDPSPDWLVEPQYLGFIDIEDPIKYFTYSNINRTKPTTIPEGSLHESVQLVVKAYRDSEYTQFYSQDNFTVNFHFLDITSTAWSKKLNDNFDNGTSQGWYAGVDWWKYYRSWPCSAVRGYYGFGRYRLFKSFDLTGNFTEAYFVASVFTEPQNLAIYLADPDSFTDGDLFFTPDVSTGPLSWYQIAFPMPLNNVTQLNINPSQGPGSTLYMDDVYILAK